uniref:uncharacterized protein LOC143311638 n=1 Tax=Arvicanthis niloticus TaxID=61156 RepID=UPI00402BDA6C
MTTLAIHVIHVVNVKHCWKWNLSMTSKSCHCATLPSLHCEIHSTFIRPPLPSCLGIVSDAHLHAFSVSMKEGVAIHSVQARSHHSLSQSGLQLQITLPQHKDNEITGVSYHVWQTYL